MLICPACHKSLSVEQQRLVCKHCGRNYYTNKSGFYELILDPTAYEKDVVTHEYAEDQTATAMRLWQQFLKPMLSSQPFDTILDVGCGIGKTISLAQQDGFDAYGVDLPALAAFWAGAGNDPQRFFCCDADRLPFPDNYFDVVWSLGVIEHIGTETGHCTLGANYQIARQNYANEIIRVTKPQGRIIIACPNKTFPIDIQHGTSDERTPSGIMTKLRNRIFERTGINIHQPFGKYHLVSYAEAKQLFFHNGGVSSFNPLPLKNYFAFGRFQAGFLRHVATIAQMYVNNLPRSLRSSFLNPYLLILMRK